MKILNACKIQVLSILVITLALTGCAESISDRFLRQADKNKIVSFDQLIKNPDQYIGYDVLLGGVIITTENKNDGTMLEVYQTELDSSGAPQNIDVSKGRFLAWDKDFLDGQIYRSGRRVTITGTVKGVEVRKIGEVDYHYPYLVIKDIYLWGNIHSVDTLGITGIIMVQCGGIHTLMAGIILIGVFITITPDISKEEQDVKPC